MTRASRPFIRCNGRRDLRPFLCLLAAIERDMRDIATSLPIRLETLRLILGELWCETNIEGSRKLEVTGDVVLLDEVVPTPASRSQ
jgi:hypothetical protein